MGYAHFFYGGAIIKKQDDLVNEFIRFKEMMVIDSNGDQLGVLSKNDALKKAFDQDLDLVCVAPNAATPVCKIMDYGKYRYEQQKKAKEARKNQSYTEVKPIRLSPVIDKHDFETKLKQASGWIDDGLKVKIDMRFRGRMMTRQEIGIKVMNDFIEALSDKSKIDKSPNLEGNIMSCILTPLKK